LLRHGSWFETFPYLHIRDAGESPLKAEYVHNTVAVGGPFKSKAADTYALQGLLETLLTEENLHIAVVGDLFERRVPAHYNCYWGLFELKSTCT